MKLFRYNLRLKQKLLIFFLLFAIVPAGVITIFSFSRTSEMISSAKEEIVNEELKKLQAFGITQSMAIMDYFSERISDIRGHMLNPHIRDLTEKIVNSSTPLVELTQHNNDLKELFQTKLISSEAVEEIILLDSSNGNVLVAETVKEFEQYKTSGNEAADPFFIEAIKAAGSSIETDEIFIKDLSFKDDIQQFTMTLSGVIREYSTGATGSVVGVIMIRIDMIFLFRLLAPRDALGQPIEEFYSATGLGQTGEIYIGNSAGLVITPSRKILDDNNFILKQLLSNSEGYSIAKEVGIFSGFQKNYNNDNVLGVYLWLGGIFSGDTRNSFMQEHLAEVNLKWVILVEIDESEIMKPVVALENELNTTLILIISGIFILLAIIILFSLYIAKSIANPLIKIANISKLISEGDLTVKLGESTSNDEIGDLSNAFKDMINFLQPIVSQLSSVSKTLASSAQELASSSEEVNATSEEISSISQQMSKGAQDQTRQIADSTNSADELRKNFDEKISDINQTAQLIEQISSQVNMLALNASIEAARAGEYGRGFAVVADNIRNLADESKKSVVSVQENIDSLKINLSKSIDEINISIEGVASVAEETASGAEEASAATEEQAATMEELTASAQQLSEMASTLETIIKRFKMD